jgi:hypothetical protein
VYLRTTQRRRSDGSVARYVQLAHNRRVDGRTRAEVLLNLGREDRLDLAALRRLAHSIMRLTDGRTTGPGVGRGGAVEVLESRPVGAAWALDALWERLGIAAALAGVVGSRPLGAATERAVFALVALRALAPGRAGDNAQCGADDLLFPDGRRIDDHNAVRAAVLTAFASDRALVEDAVVSGVAEPAGLRLDRLFVLAKRMRFPLDETYGADMQIAVAMTREGIPVRVWRATPGTRLGVERISKDLRGMSASPATWVLDRAQTSETDLRRLRRAGVSWVAGRPARDVPVAARDALTRPGRYHADVRGARLKEAGRPGARRLVVLHDLAEADSERTRRDESVARLETELGALDDRHARDATAGARRRAARAARLLREHPVGARYLRRTPDGRLAVDRSRVAADVRLDGKHLLETSDPDLSASDMAAGYRNLPGVQRRLRTLIAASPPPPGAGRLDDRAQAHLVLCWLALVLIRIAEQATGQAFEHIEHEMQRLHLVVLEGPEGRVEQTTPLTPGQREIMAALETEAPCVTQAL